MPKYLLNSGLAATPVGLPDKEAAVVTPLYQAVYNLAQRVSEITGHVTYSGFELASLDRSAGLQSASFSKLTAQAGEPLSYGDMLHIGVSGSELVAVRASNDNPGLWANAVCDTVGGVAAGQFFQALWMQGRTRGITGSIFGATYYLATGGAISSSVPGGGFTQIVGTGLAGAGFYLNIRELG
jgi:hypothetical protein